MESICDSIKSCQLNGIYRDIAEHISIDVALLMYKQYKGLQVNFPKKLYAPEYVRGQVIQSGRDSDFKKMARQYDYSERWLRQMLKDTEK